MAFGFMYFNSLSMALAVVYIERAIGQPIVSVRRVAADGFHFEYRIDEDCYAGDAHDLITFTATERGGYKVGGDLTTLLRCADTKLRQDEEAQS